jgi:hypothetical protein
MNMNQKYQTQLMAASLLHDKKPVLSMDQIQRLLEISNRTVVRISKHDDKDVKALYHLLVEIPNHTCVQLGIWPLV